MDNTKLTELEKKWLEAAEEAEEELSSLEHNSCCGSCDNCSSEEDSSMDEEFDDLAFQEESFVKYPFSDVFMPMAIIESGNKSYLGGLAELDPSTGVCVVVSPMLFQEQFVMNEKDPTGEPGLSIMMRVPYVSLGCLDGVHLKSDMVYFLKNNKPEDMRLASSYERNFTQTRAAQSNIVTPTEGDVVQLSQRR